MRRLATLLLIGVASGQDTGKVRDPAPEGLRAAEAVDRGLRWLAAHQDEDGRWDAKGFMKHDPGNDRCDGAGHPLFDVGVTGLATLAFLGGGFTDRGDARENPHADTVRRALGCLIEQQAADGCFGTRSTHAFMYNHAIATIAMCDAYALRKDPVSRYLRPAEDGIAFILAARNPGAGWRYEPRGGESDTSVTAWCVTALLSARRCGFDVPQQALDDAIAWVDRMTEPNFGHVGYNYPGGHCCRTMAAHETFPAGKSASMTAAGLRIRLLCGQQGTDAIRKGTAHCLSLPPLWDGSSNDFYYWHWGTLVMRQLGGDARKTWCAKLEQAVLPRQRREGASGGSWDPADPWGADGGRVYSTAMLVLCLEAAQR